LETKLSILRKHGLNIGDKYNIINTPLASRGADVLAKYIPNNYKTITIDNIAPCPGLLLSLIEDAETINIGDTSNVNLIYHCQYKGIMKPVYVNFHVWCNDRSWPQYNLDHAWKMMADPTLENWRFIFKNI
jgi:hypothetical protein